MHFSAKSALFAKSQLLARIHILRRNAYFAEKSAYLANYAIFMKMTSKMTNKPCATAIFPACDENHRYFMKFRSNYVKIEFCAFSCKNEKS